MGNSVSRVVGCFVPGTHDQDKVAVFFSEPLDEGLGHSFCYVRPVLDSPHLSPSHSDGYGAIPVALDSETRNGSLPLNQENAEDTHKPKNLSETSFKSISGASVSANTSTPRTIASHEQFNSFANVSYDRAAAFESTSSFSSLPLQPVPRGISVSGPISGSLSGPASGPLDRGFLSGPLERGFMSGPLERGFMSGPLERGCMSGPIEPTDRGLFSAPLAGPYMNYLRRRKMSLARLVRTFGKPVKRALSRTLSKTSSTLARTQRSLAAPVKQLVWGHASGAGKEGTTPYDCPLDLGYSSSDLDSRESHNLHWAQGKAGEDRVHVVLSEEHGWLFVGIYDGFNGPDAPDFLMSNLYRAIYRELRGLLWDRKERLAEKLDQGVENQCQGVSNSVDTNQDYREADAGSLGNSEESRNLEPEVCGCLNGSNLDRIGRSCEAATGHAHVEDFVRPDYGNDNAELDGCTQESHLMERGEGCVTQAGFQALGREMQPQGDSYGSEISPQLPPTGDHTEGCQLVKRGKFSDPNSSMMIQTAGSVEEVDPAGPTVQCQSNDATEMVSDEKCTSDQNFENPRQGKHKKTWTGRSLLKSKLRQTHSRRKENHRKLFPWGWDWDQDRKEAQKKVEENFRQGVDKQCRQGSVDHAAVLKALARALDSTERAYLQMADHAMEETPELALMGSCVMVMLMKDEDVYVMNVGDSRAILAQQLKSEPHGLSKCSRGPAPPLVDDSDRIGARDSQLRQELERIIEETPTELETFESSYSSSSAGPPATSPSLCALQLSTDHSTNIEEEVLRIKAEHPDDKKSISNERVKGRLKVTRAFGAGFLKMPRWNNALLEMFRVDYVGTAPYVTCTPALQHHMLGPNDRFLVLSSDGLYQYLSNEEVVSHVEWFMEKFPDGDPAQHLIEELLFRAAKKAGMDFHELLDIPQGDRRKYHDDVSVMVISLEGRIWRSSG